MDRESLVYVDLEGVPHLMGRLWARVRNNKESATFEYNQAWLEHPARFSLAHGGKDRHPYPVPIKVYDETIRVMKSAVRNAKLGPQEELGALKRLDDQARLLEQKV